jgi:hypothetical protein
MAKAHQLRALTSAAEAQQALEKGIAHVDSRRSDSARRSFEAEHLAMIRADARSLKTEPDEVARLADAAIRQLEADR